MRRRFGRASVVCWTNETSLKTARRSCNEEVWRRTREELANFQGAGKPPKTSKTLPAVASTQNSIGERKILTKYNSMTQTRQHPSAKTKLLVIFASAFIGLTSCEKPDKADGNVPQPQTELSIPEELREEFQKIEPYSYIADFNKTGKVYEIASKRRAAMIAKIADIRSFTETEVEEKFFYWQMGQYMKHGSDESISIEEQETLLEDLKVRLERMQILFAATKKREAGNEEEASQLANKYWELRFARPPKSPQLRAAEKKMKLLVYMKFDLHNLENQLLTNP